jgi:predicted GTPase
MAHSVDTTNVIIMGAAGRDFHDFNTYWKDRPEYNVVAFTATQIPDIDGRVYPAGLTGQRYPGGIPIHAEEELESLIKEHDVKICAQAYSDLNYNTVMSLAARVNAAGAHFIMLSPHDTMLPSSKPVIAICAVRTGCGKSQTTRAVCDILKKQGKKVAVARHPMPYGDLEKQVCQRFAEYADMDKHECTIEEREEYEPHIDAGNILYAGVDYEQILRSAEQEADVVVWDGGNNDTAFFKPDLYICVADPHRAGHETSYYPGETNARLADLIVLNKVDSADENDVKRVEENLARINPDAKILRAASPCTVDQPDLIKGKRVLLVEDGPTLTHGEMEYGAGYVAARNLGAAEIVDPRPYAVGSIKTTFEKYRHLTQILPAMGYGRKQMEELQETIKQVPCDVVVVGTPIDLGRLITIDKPSVRVRYNLDPKDPSALEQAVLGVFDRTAAPVG